MAEIFDNELNGYFNEIEKTNICIECEKPIHIGNTYCSLECYKQNQI